MYFTNGSSRAFEMLMRGKPGFDRYAECPYEPGKLTALRRGTAK